MFFFSFRIIALTLPQTRPLSLNTYQFAKSERNRKAKDLDISELDPRPPLSIYICAPIFGEQKAKDLNFTQIDSSLCRVYSQGKQKEKDLDISKPTSRGFPSSKADVCQELGKCFRKAGQTGASNLSTILINPKNTKTY